MRAAKRWTTVTLLAVAMAGGGLLAAEKTLPWPEERRVCGLAWTRDGEGILVFYLKEHGAILERRSLAGWEVGWQTETLNRPFGTMNALALSPDGERVLVLERMFLEVFSVSTGERMLSLDLRGEVKRYLLAACVRPDGNPLVLVEEWAGIPTELYLEERNREGELLRREPLGTGFMAPPKPWVVFSPDGRYLLYAAGTVDQPAGASWTVRLRDLASGEETSFDLRELLPDPGWENFRLGISSLALRPDAKEFAVGLFAADPGKPILLRVDVETGKLIEAPLHAVGEYAAVETLVYSPDGRRLAASISNYSLRGGPAELTVLQLGPRDSVTRDLCSSPNYSPECPRALPSFSPDGRTLATVSWTSLALWDLCPEIPQLPASGWGFSFSSGGAYHPTGHGEWRVRLDPSGSVELEHRVMDDVETYGPFDLGPEEAKALWGLIQMAEIPCLSSSTRAGLPDEPLFVFSLEGPDSAYRVELWRGDVEESEALMALVDALATLIETYTGEEPRL